MKEQSGQPTVYRLIIDVETHSKSKLISRLRRLITTIDVQDGGAYREDAGYSQVHLDTVKTEREVDDWLYRTKGIDYVGVVALPPPNTALRTSPCVEMKS